MEKDPKELVDDLLELYRRKFQTEKTREKTRSFFEETTGRKEVKEGEEQQAQES